MVLNQELGSRLQWKIVEAFKLNCYQDAYSMYEISLVDTEPKKTWLDGMIFEEWLRELDRKFARQGRVIIMIADNYPAHPEI